MAILRWQCDDLIPPRLDTFIILQVLTPLSAQDAQGNAGFCTLSADRSFKRLPFVSASKAQITSNHINSQMLRDFKVDVTSGIGNRIFQVSHGLLEFTHGAIHQCFTYRQQTAADGSVTMSDAFQRHDMVTTW